MTDIVARLRNAVRTADLPFDQIDTERQEAADEIERRLGMHPEKLHLENWRWRPWRTCGPAANSEAMVARNRRSRSRSSNSVSNGLAQRYRGRLIGLSVWQTMRVGFQRPVSPLKNP